MALLYRLTRTSSCIFIELFWLEKPTEVGCELFMVSDRPLIEFLGNLSTNDAVALVDRFEAANH